MFDWDAVEVVVDAEGTISVVIPGTADADGYDMEIEVVTPTDEFAPQE